MENDNPPFDYSKPFEVVEEKEKPPFDLSKPYEVPPDDHGRAARMALSPLEKAISPITSYPETYNKMRREGSETVSHGVGQLANPKGGWDLAKGVGNVALGSVEYTLSPINALYRSVVGQPIEDITGIPREYTEVVAQLATPGLGLRALSPKVPGAAPKPSEMQPRVAGREAVPEAKTAEEFNIPLSRGQATRDLDAIRYEDLASRGGYGPAAQKEASEFFDQQFKAIQAAGVDVGELLGRTGTKTGGSGESAGIINLEVLSVAEKARAVTAHAERVAQQEFAAQQAMSADRARTIGEAAQLGKSSIDGVREAGEVVGEGVRNAAQTAKNEYKGLYREAFALPGEFHAGTFENIGSRIRGDLTLRDAPVIVDDTTKIATNALNDVDKMSNLQFKNVADPFGAPNPENIIAVNLKGVDQARKLLVARYTQARAAGRASQDFSDQRAMEAIIDAFDNHIERSISNGLFSGDPRALSALQEARASFSNYRKNYRPNAGDDVSQNINRIVARNATPEEIGNMIVGSGRIGNAGLPVRLAERLRGLLGEDSNSWSAIRQSIWQKASQVRNTAGEIDPAKSARSLQEFTGSSLARTVFLPEEINAMRFHARGVQEMENLISVLPETRAAELARATYQKFFEPADIGGSQATVMRRIIDGSATPQETVNAVFDAVNGSSSGNVSRMIKAIENITGPNSDTMNAIRQGVWQQFTKEAAGKIQPGQQKVSQAIGEFLSGKGRQVAEQLYSPEEISLMKKYAEAIKLTVIPPRAATRSDTTVGLMSVVHKYSGAISAALGEVFGHGAMGAVTGYGVGKIIQKGFDKIKEMKEMNRIRTQFEPPSGPTKITVPPGRRGLPPTTAPVLANPPQLSLPNYGSTVTEKEQPRAIPQITIHKEPSRATGGSVFDKMHMARKRAEGGGTDAPFNEWDAVPRNAEGIPQIRIEKPPVNEADEAQAAREAAHDPNNIGMSEADHGGFASTGKKLSEGIIPKMFDAIVGEPSRQMKPTGWPAGSEEDDYINAGKRRDAMYWGPDMALNMAGVGGPLAMTNAGKNAIGIAGGRGVKSALANAALEQPQGIRAYHGSPHDFDKFDLAKIGTGEGAQSYGHGLYFAEKEGTARSYRDALSQGNPEIAYKGKPVPVYTGRGLSESGLPPEQYYASMFGPKDDPAFAREAHIQYLESQKRMIPTRDDLPPSVKDRALKGLDEQIAQISLFDPAAIEKLKQGHMYEVNINAKPEQFLDWDKPLSKQAPQAQDAFKQLGFEPNPNKYPSMKEAENLFNSYRVQKLAYDDIGTRESLKKGLDLVRAGDKTGFQNWFDHSGGILSPGRHKDIRGQDLYYELGNKAGMADPTASFKARYPQASAQLNEAGIPGIKYLDQGSRGTSGGSSNYVVFDSNIIEIMKKYGMTLPAATAAYEAMKSNQEKTGFKKGGSVFDKMKRASK